MTIQEIKDYPTCIGNNHESLLQSFQLLKKVKEMLERGDSKKTILEVIYFVQEPSKLQENKTCNHVWGTSKEIHNGHEGNSYAVCIKCLYRPDRPDYHRCI